MEPPIYKRRFEELQRCFGRVKRLYAGKIINEPGEDSFNSPKDLVLNFFRVSYELKESLKKEPNIASELKGYHGVIEKYCSSDQYLALSLDIANQTKHRDLSKNKSGKNIGVINTHIHVISPNGKDRTELTIEIDGNKEDCLKIIEKCFNSWSLFLQKYDL